MKSALNSSTRAIAGRILRWPLRLIPRKMTMPILCGPMRGKKWVVGAGNHSCWLGTYEAEKQTAIASAVMPGNTILDIGAHVGFFTLLFSVLAGQDGRIVAFEPLPDNVQKLKRHLTLNRCTNVRVHQAAVAASDGQATFALGVNSYTGRLTARGSVSITVDVVSVDDIVSRERLAPDLLKIDVEGAELSVLQGAQATVRQFHPMIFLATHGTDMRIQCTNWLRQQGYVLEPLEGKRGNTLETTDEYCAYFLA